MDPIKAQMLISSGMAWKLEGSIGRACMDMIEHGQCMCGVVSHLNYCGNYVPSRTEVVEGTVGSRGYVVEMFGSDHADALDSVPSNPCMSDLMLILRD